MPGVPPKHNRRTPWEYDHARYARRHASERLFRRLKGFRRLFSRGDKRDVMCVGFINFALIVEGLWQCYQALDKPDRPPALSSLTPNVLPFTSHVLRPTSWVISLSEKRILRRQPD